jgi:hypothetical protein
MPGFCGGEVAEELACASVRRSAGSRHIEIPSLALHIHRFLTDAMAQVLNQPNRPAREEVRHMLATQGYDELAFKVADSQVASRWGNILEFRGFDLITPNEREARFALGDQDLVVRPLGLELYRQASCKTLILKLGERGLLTFQSVPKKVEDVRAFFALDSFADRIVDAVGSGDALLAYAALALYSSGSPLIASVLGSLAAAVECEHEGNVPVSPKNVTDKLERFERLANFR